MDEFDISMRKVQGVVILDLTGRIELGDSGTLLLDTLHELVDAGARSVILNLERVTAIDSCGLGTLVSGYTTLERSGGRLKLVSLSPKVAELLTITKLYIVFEIFENEAEAIRSFNDKTDRVAKPLDIHSTKLAPGDTPIL